MATHPESDFAIIGLSCRFPGAADFGRDRLELELGLEPPGQFDAGFFHLSPAEASAIGPQPCILLELFHAALEHGGYDPDRSPTRVGVFTGTVPNTSARRADSRDCGLEQCTPIRIEDCQDPTNAWIAAKLNLKGPSVVIQTTASPFVSAVHRACQSLSRGETELALAGAVSVSDPPRPVALRGGVVVLLKRLTDALSAGDTVHAVIKDLHVPSEVLTQTAAPSPTPSARNGKARSDEADGDQFDAATELGEVIQAILALKHPRLAPNPSGAEAGPELHPANAALAGDTRLRRWASDGPRRATVMCTGMHGTSARLVLEQAPEPPNSANGKAPQLLIVSARTDNALEQATQRLQEFLLRSDCVNMSDLAYTLQIGRKAFAHRRALVCVDQKDALTALATEGSKRVLFNRTSGGLPRPIVFLLPGVGDQYVGMADELYATWAVFRQEVDRCAQILSPHLGLDIRGILYPSSQSWRKPGQSKGIDFKRMLGRKADEPEDPDTIHLNSTLFVQSGLFTIEYAMARLWQSLGITPDAIVGHSMGEYVAACLAGVFSLDDALRLIAVRAQLVHALPQGTMLSVMLSEEELQPLLPADLVLALINGPNHCVIAGTVAAVTEFEKLLAARNIISRRVQNGHAFHSSMMDPAVAAFTAEVRKVQLSEPNIPYVSNVTGSWVTAAQATDPSYWGKHLNHTARFSDALHHMWRLADPILLECGPGRTLSVLAAQHPTRNGTAQHLSPIWSIRQRYEHAADEQVLLNAIGKLWLLGVDISWERIQPTHLRRRVPLPTYPFERENYWAGETSDKSTNTEPQGAPPEHAVLRVEAMPPTPVRATRPLGSSSYVAPRNDLEISLARTCERVLGVQGIGITDNFFELGGHSLAVIKLVFEMKKSSGLEINLGEVFHSPTIEELVQSMGMEAKKNASIVVPLQRDGDEVPIFCLCGIDIYKEFAQSLGEDQPVFGVYVEEEQAIINDALEGGEAPNGATGVVSIERLVHAYFEAIVRFRPQGPYRLAGLSFGGMLAVALAHKIRERGDKVDVVFLFDTLLPGGRRRKWLKWALRQVVEVATNQKFRRLYSRFRKRAPVRAENQDASDKYNSSFYQQFYERQRGAFAAAAKHWQARRQVVDFPVVLFRASTHDMWAAEFTYAKDYGWNRYLAGSLSVVSVAGGHTSLMASPHVSDLACKARRFLRSEPAESAPTPQNGMYASLPHPKVG